MASMKVIRAVAPSGGPGGLYTAIAFPSTEYGPLFAEYVTQHKEESGKHHLIMTASMKVIRVMAPSGGPSGRRPRGRGLISLACILQEEKQAEGGMCSGRQKILQANCT